MENNINDSTTTRQFLDFVAANIKKKPSDVDNYVKILEDNWIENVAAIKQLDDDQWKQLGIPMGLVNQIKQQIQSIQNTQSSLKVETQVSDSSSKNINQGKEKIIPVQTISLVDDVKIDLPANETFESCLIALKDQFYDKGEKLVHQDIVKTLLKVVENLKLKPTDTKVRSLPKSNKSVNEKILVHQYAAKFLELVGFDFQGNEFILLQNYDGQKIESALDSIYKHIESLGGQVQLTSTFDPTKQYKILNTGEKWDKPPGLSAQDEDKYDPTKVQQMIEQVKKQREKELEDKVADRQIKIIATSQNPQNLKKILFEIDQQEIQRLKQLNLSEDKLEAAQSQAFAVKFLQQQEKQSKFQNKRLQEFEKIINQPNHPRGTVRIKFPDGYLLQGTFGALEKVEDIYKFVNENIFYKDQREFYLFETPPKKIFDETLMKSTLHKQNLVPSCMIYFAWKDLEETKPEHGPFLNIQALKDKIVQI